MRAPHPGNSGIAFVGSSRLSGPLERPVRRGGLKTSGVELRFPTPAAADNLALVYQ